MKIKFVNKMHETSNIYTFKFEKPDGFRQIAGQFIELSLPDTPADERGQKRWFTLSNSPTEEFLSITTRLFTPKKSNFKTILENLSPGQHLQMAETMGDFVLPKDPKIPLIFVASGIGCTPYRSIIKSLIDTGGQRNITLIHNVADQTDLVFSEIFETLGGEYTSVVGKNKLTAGFIRDIWAKKRESYIYLSGPEPLIETLNQDLVDLNLSSQRIFTDSFPGYK